MDDFHKWNDDEIRNRFNEEHGKLRENLQDLSGYLSEKRLQWARAVMLPALGVFAELGASDALNADERRKRLPELTGARKLTDALLVADSDRKQPAIWQSLKRSWEARNQED